MSSLINIKNVYFSYSNTYIFKNISLNINSDEFIGVIGESGSGKSTLLKLLAGLEKPNRGGRKINCPVLGGFVFQSPVLMDWLNVEQNITFPNININQKTERLEQLIYDIGLSDSKLKYPRELSGGMKSRVQLARALFQQPNILFLDEAFSSLDEKLRIQLNLLVKALRNTYKFSAVIVSHSIQESVLLSDRILILERKTGATNSIIHEITGGLIYSREGIEVFKDQAFQLKLNQIREKLLNA